MDPDESPDEDRPLFSYLPPDDRLWRHPSEMRDHPTGPVLLAAPPAPHGTAARTWTIALLAGVVGALVASGVGVVVGSFDRRTTLVLTPAAGSATARTLVSAPSVSSPDWYTVADLVSSSVAAVTADGPNGPRVGSGVVDATGGQRTYLLTDAALVGQAGSITVTFNGSMAERAYLLRTDPMTGLAVLWVQGDSHPAPQLGSVGDVHQADGVIAIGARASDMAASVPGSVSSVDRTVADTNSSVSVSGLLALSGGMPPADAGGAIVDQQGLVVGIATSITSPDPGDSGLTFAVPIDVAEHVAAEMMLSESVTHPWLGIIESADLDSATAARMGISGGAEVIGVASGSPLARTRLGSQDVVTSLDGRQVTSSGQLTALMARCVPGHVATLGYRAGGRSGTARVEVAEQPGDVDGS